MPPIRQSDIIALLVRSLVYTKQYNEAAKALKELALREPNWSSTKILEKSLVQKIANETTKNAVSMIGEILKDKVQLAWKDLGFEKLV